MKTLLITVMISVAVAQNVTAYDHDSSEAKLMQGIKDYKQSRNKFKRHGTAEESRAQTVARLDRELQKSDYLKVKNDVKKYAKHHTNEAIIGYMLLGVNQGTRLLNIKSGEVQTLPKNWKTTMKLGIIKEYISPTNPQIIGNYFHIYMDGGVEHIILNTQAFDYEMSNREIAKIRKERFGL